MLLPETREFQIRLGEYCRTGILPEIPGIDKKHIGHYRRLIRNVVSNNLKQAFPITAQVTGTEMFREMADEFFMKHDARTSQIWKLPGEFYSYAVNNSWPKRFGLPWLGDLLYFEWTELKVHTMPDGIIPPYTAGGDMFRDRLVFNPDHEIIRLNYPVHMYPVSEASEKKGNYFLLVFRDLSEGKVSFISLSAFFAHLLFILTGSGPILGIALDNTLREFRTEGSSKFGEAAGRLMDDLYKQGFLLGYSKA